MRTRLLFIPVFAIILTGCAGGWTEEDKKAFRQDCVESVGSQIDAAQRSAYCDCFTGQMVKTYPVFNDAMEHQDTAKLEAARAHCRKEIGMQ